MLPVPDLSLSDALSIFALISALVSIALTLRAGSVYTLHQRVTSLQLELAEVLDRFEAWTKRDRVRLSRAGHEAQPIAPPEPARGTPEYKAFLRQRAGVLRSVVGGKP